MEGGCCQLGILYQQEFPSRIKGKSRYPQIEGKLRQLVDLRFVLKRCLRKFSKQKGNNKGRILEYLEGRIE